MKIIQAADFQDKLPDCAATIGFFDGVHEGHRFLINDLKGIAHQKEQKSMVITFLVHPRKVLQPQAPTNLLTTFEEKMKLLNTTGIDYCIVLDFSVEMAKLTAFEFLQFIRNSFSTKTLLIGYDHRFGHNRVEGFEEYVRFGEELGIEVVLAKVFRLGNDLDVSSSKIRHLLQDGKIETANKLLGYNYNFEGEVVHGKKNGKKIGFPTANLQLENQDKQLPLQGVFTVDIEHQNKMYRGMMSIGYNPTFGDKLNRTIEVNIFNFDKEIYGEKLKVYFLKKIRDEEKFSSVETLIERLKEDKKEAVK